MKSGGVNVWLATPSQSVRIRGHDSRQSDSEWIKGNGRILAHFAARHKGMDAGAVLFASLCGAAVDEYAHTHQLPQLSVAELAHWLALHPAD